MDHNAPGEESQVDMSKVLLTDDATRYLSAAWGRPVTTRDFMNWRVRHREKLEALGITPDVDKPRIKGWRKEKLDRMIQEIPAPELRPYHGKPAKKRPKLDEQ